MPKEENKPSWELSEDEKDKLNKVEIKNVSKPQSELNSDKNKKER